MYSKTTRQIKIIAMPQFLPQQSDPLQQHFVWAYTIQLENIGEETVQLLRRYWHITDASGMVQEVRGDGVVGETPVLEPGDVFQYTSGVSLKTASGIMGGHYEMTTGQNEVFLIDIPTFSLDSPQQIQRPN